MVRRRMTAPSKRAEPARLSISPEARSDVCRRVGRDVRRKVESLFTFRRKQSRIGFLLYRGFDMNRTKHLLWFSVMLLTMLIRADAQENSPAPPPPKYRMELVYIFDSNSTELIFVIGNAGFKSVDSLKTFLRSLPPGSSLEWAPGCIRMGNEPLLSSEREMEEFRAFCAESNINFILVPSG